VIKPKCVRCRSELTTFGAVILSPPHHDAITTPFVQIVSKMHMCADCFELLRAWLAGPLTDEESEQLKLRM
jgi:hypothetical protein